MENNLNLIFNKTYYQYLDNCNNGFYEDKFKKSIDKCNDIIFDTKFFYKRDYVKNEIANISFDLKTTYPGVIIGTGYAHGVGVNGVDNDVNCGFSFDYVSGQPYYPSTSVKGVLRSGFDHPEMIKSILGEDWTDEEIKALEFSIFGDDTEKTQGVDVFFNAVVKFSCNKNKYILSKDYITPHTEGPTKNPVPIMIIKVLPDVVFEFDFKLQNSTIGEKTINAEQKKDLFKRILMILGVGAKTNVGYGAMINVELKDEDLENDVPREPTIIHQNGQNNQNRQNVQSNQNRQNGQGNPNDQTVQNIPSAKEKKLEKMTPVTGVVYEGEIFSVEGQRVKIKVANKELSVVINNAKNKAGKKIKVGEKIKVEIIDGFYGFANIIN